MQVMLTMPSLTVRSYTEPKKMWQFQVHAKEDWTGKKRVPSIDATTHHYIILPVLDHGAKFYDHKNSCDGEENYKRNTATKYKVIFFVHIISLKRVKFLTDYYRSYNYSIFLLLLHNMKIHIGLP